MKKLISWLLCLNFILIITLGAEPAFFYKDESAFNTDPVQVQLIHEDETVQPGRPFWIALHMKIEDKWHSYWKNPGDAGMAPSVEWSMPEGFVAEPILWPYPQKFILNTAIGYGYENDVILLSRVTPPDQLSSAEDINIGASIRWVVCNDATCVPGMSETTITMLVDHEVPSLKKEWETQFTEARAKLPKATTNILAESQADFIQIHVEAEDNLPETTLIAEFFPEDNETIDHKVNATVIRDEGNPNRYTLCLKRNEVCEDTVDTIKGVLVLKTEDECCQILEAVEVDTPLSKDKDSLISLVHLTPQKSSGIKSNQDNEFGGSVMLAILFAFAGGMILNLMPCVLPVISFKVLSFVKMAGQGRAKTFKHGLAFSFGVLLSFWALAGVMLALQAYGNIVGWGFQLQEPIFVAILAAIIFVFGMSLFGVFEIGASFASWAGSQQTKSQQQSDDGYTSSFASGILATAVATPCTGPFLGSAVGFAMALPPVQAMLIFTSLGLGMAFPYLILGAFPQLLRFLPKPGNWMITFKEVMGFVMLATVLWLIWVFGAQTSSFAVSILLIGFFFLSLGCWILGKWGSPVKKKTTRLISYAITLSCFVIAGFMIADSSFSEANNDQTIAMDSGNHQSHSVWEKFSPERVAELREQGRPVLVDFTAKWCLICQTNHFILSSKEVSAKLDKLGVVRMKADWTRKDDIITKELRKFNRGGVPLYLLYGPDGEHPEILPQVLTPEIVLNQLDKIEQQLLEANPSDIEIGCND